MRVQAQNLRELIRKNTLDPRTNKCEFDETMKDKKLKAAPIRKNAPHP